MEEVCVLSPDNSGHLKSQESKGLGEEVHVPLSGVGGAGYEGQPSEDLAITTPFCDPWNYRPLAREHWSDSSSFSFYPFAREDMSSGYREGHAGGFIEHPLSPGPLCDLGHQAPFWQFLASPLWEDMIWPGLGAGHRWQPGDLPALIVCSSGQGPG